MGEEENTVYVSSSQDVVIPIENTISFNETLGYVDRYFICKYYLNLNEENNDHCILIHSNRLCVLTLAPSHPIVRRQLKIDKIDFQVSKNVNRLENKACGKRKRNAQNLNINSPVCFVECSNNKRFTISSPISGKLLEINEKLLHEPDLLHYSYRENYHKECFVAIINPKHNVPMEEVTKDLIDESKYRQMFSRPTQVLNEV